MDIRAKTINVVEVIQDLIQMTNRQLNDINQLNIQLKSTTGYNSSNNYDKGIKKEWRRLYMPIS